MDRNISNLVTGDRIEFIASPLLGDGETLIFRGILPPDAAGAPLHTHDDMTESFVVEQGALEIDLGKGAKRRLQPGEELVLDAGTPHGFRNALGSETRFITTATPGAELERFLRSMYGLANDGLTDNSGAPRSPLAMAAVLGPMDMAMVGVPRSIQRTTIKILGGIAGLTGIAARIARHSGEGAA